ncbi:ABC transporter substrate-binding protein [Paenibacillus pinistramenti]|uniref:ABC transporter substrate-binding protein n=1 Tax=Paenibacillus pinistramenti TaxID=1768003 RepID=UPI001108455C|nr:ABC transporter substrate-binding protein [Paenibacillus pinistramenti]
MLKFKRLIPLLVLALVLILSACGNSASNEGNPAASTGTDLSSNSSSNSSSADSSGSSTSNSSNTDASLSSTSDKADQILASNPNARIASISIHITNDLLAIGITPVGSVIGGDVKDFLPHVKDLLQDADKYGTVTDPDMEAILASKPDVIFLDENYSGKDIAKFEQIAPTLTINTAEGTWQEQLTEIAKHAGRAQQAEEFIQNYTSKAEKVSQLIHAELGDNAKVMAIRSTAKELRVMGMGHPLGPIMFDELKLVPANGVEKINKAYETVSQEVLPDYDADAIFVIISTGSTAKANFEALESNPLWENLKAVKNNHVYILDGQKWLDYSALGQDMALDDAEKLFSSAK